MPCSPSSPLWVGDVPRRWPRRVLNKTGSFPERTELSTSGVPSPRPRGFVQPWAGSVAQDLGNEHLAELKGF